MLKMDAVAKCLISANENRNVQRGSTYVSRPVICHSILTTCEVHIKLQARINSNSYKINKITT